MSRWAGTVIAVALGAMVTRLGLTGGHRVYVRDHMGPWLVLAGATLVVLALACAWSSTDDDAHARPRVALLLLVPLVTVYLIAPPALGAYAAARAPSVDPAATAPASAFPPLAVPLDGVVDLTLTEFIQRAALEEGRTLDGVRVRLRGFVVLAPDVADAFLLTRFRIACCAADGLALQVRVTGLDGPPPPADAWVTVEGDLVDMVQYQPHLRATALTLEPVPGNPYES